MENLTIMILVCQIIAPIIFVVTFEALSDNLEIIKENNND